MKNMSIIWQAFRKTFTVQNFVEAFRGKPFGQWFMNSLILTVAAAFITGIIALLAGYAFAKMRFKGKKVLFGHDRSADVCSSGSYDYTAVPDY